MSRGTLIAQSSSFAVLLVSLTTGSCGGIADVSSGLPPDKLGQDLTEAEVQQLCRTVEAYAQDYPSKEDARCRVLGLVNTPDTVETLGNAQFLCQSWYDSCAPEVVIPGTFCRLLDDSEDILGRCAATLEDIETCIGLDVRTSTEIANSLRACSEIDLDYVDYFQTTLLGEMQVPSGCDHVYEICPAVFR